MKPSVCLLLAAIAWTEHLGGHVVAQEIDDTMGDASAVDVVGPAYLPTIVCDGVVACERSAYEPVCTTKRTTFANACEFKNAYCEQPSDTFYIVSIGPCIHVQSVDDDENGDTEEPPTVTQSVLNVPVELDEDHADASAIPVVTEDECDGNVACDNTYDPVCTSKGRTYRNPCEFKNAFCERPRPSFKIVAKGPCSELQVQSIEDEDEEGVQGGGVSEEVLNVPIDVEDNVTGPSIVESDNVESPVVDAIGSLGGTSGDEDAAPFDPTRPSIDCSDGNLACDMPDAPVCASNGFTYINACQFKNAYCETPSVELYIVGPGPCDSTEVPLQVQSISDEEKAIWGTVFDVPVELGEHAGIAQPSAVDCDGNLQCSNTYDPVCTSEGRTFRNECEFKNAFCENTDSGMFIVSKGGCFSTSEVETSDDSTTTGGVSSDVLNAPVELDEVAVDADSNNNAQRSRQKLSPFCTLSCPTGNVLVAPICGTDGTSYINDCHLLSTKCEQPDLEKQYDGLCVMGRAPSSAASSARSDDSILTQEASSRPKCNAFCDRSYEPVCGSNGVTYANPCLFEFAHCQNVGITKLGDGKCAEINSASIAEQSNQQQNNGACVPDVCPGTAASVCGSDGQTYLNVCMLNNARCQIPGLKVAHVGACGAHTKLTCATLTCPRYSECRHDPATQVAYCADVCHAERCGPNETCKLRIGDCTTAPCSPVATCVPNPNSHWDDY